MRPGSEHTVGFTAPSPRSRPSPLAAPEFATLRDVRRALGKGGMPSQRTRSPECHARIAAFRALDELLSLLDEYGRRVESGDRCRLVEREHKHVPGRLHLELVIEVES